MTSTVFAHVPYPQIDRYLELVLAKGINPELFFPNESLDSVIPEKLQALASALAGAGLSCTIHAPFMDLSPGSPEPMLRNATLHRFHQILEVAAMLQPQVVVFHPGYDRWRYGDIRDKWLGYSIETWQTVLDLSAGIGCKIGVENIFEEEPSTLRALFEAIDSPRFGHCFDVGHWHLFSRLGMAEWFAQVGNWIVEAHIHDNHGKCDDHAPLGEGTIDFDLFFRLMKQYAPQAAWTLEAHNQGEMDRALRNIQPYLGG